MDLGQVSAAPNGTTTFRVDPQSGQVSVANGAGYRLSASLVRVLVTITCTASGNDNGNGNDNQNNGTGNGKGCKNNRVGVSIGDIGAVTGRALPLTNYMVSMTSASLYGSVSGSNPVSFTLNPIGAGQTASFYLGADFPVAGDDSGKQSGLGFSPFFVYVTSLQGDQLGSAVGAGAVNAYRALTISKSSDLKFGTVTRPVQGSGSVTIDPLTSGRSFTGGVAGIPTIPFGPATFTVSGEGGQAFFVSVPGTIQLSGPTNLNVQTATNAPASPYLSSTSGAGGSFTLRIGGTIPVSSGSITGAYSGVFNVTVGYN